MNRKIRLLCVILATGFASVSLAATAGSGTTVTRTLHQTVSVPSGDSVTVENLAGHVRVIQGSGPMQVTATVNAGGRNAQALAHSVRLAVSTVGNDVRVHVYYPVDRYQTYLYSPHNSKADGTGGVCIRDGAMCFYARRSSTLTYQGKRVRVNQSSGSGSGAPVYVDVVVDLPARVRARVNNAFGLLQSGGRADDLDLATQGGGIYVQSLRGQMNVTSNGGNVYLGNVTTTRAHVATDGRNVSML